MEKEPQPESMATVNIKPEYTPSEYSASEPPPAYMKPRSTSVQIAKIIAATVVICSVILGGFLLASAYVTANASCKQLEQELDILSEAAERFQSPLQPEALIQDPSVAASTNFKRQVDPLNAEAPSRATKELTNHIDDDSSSESDSSEDSEELPTKESKKSAALPIEMNDLISHLLEKNQKSKMNCVVEKKKAEEFVDHQPRTVSLPFGINLTTNPRFEKLTGERMVIICESGSMQHAEPPMRPKEEKEDEEDNDDQDEETIMIHPIMIPIPQTPFQTHMPQQMAPMPQQMAPMPQQRPEQIRPIIQIESFRPPMPAMRQPMMPQQQSQEQMQMRPPMRPQIQIHVQPQQPQQAEFPPNPILQHIVRQIVAQKIMESQKLREQQLKEQQEAQQQQQQQVPSEVTQEVDERPRFVQIEQIGQPIGEQRFPLPEEILTQLNRLPNREVIVAVPDNDSEEPQQDVQYVQQQRQSADEMNGRQTYGRTVPISIPVAMTHDPEVAEPEQSASDERHHFVQPRSV